jgi:transcriptional regulator with XRE-family HTH domain
MLNRVENNQSTADVERPDPEAQAGRALRRLRLSHGWSQEEVAKRMQAYGHEFHQTMVAKIEAAQRPLRVRELADFAAMYGVGVNELIYAPSGSLEEVAHEIAEVEARWLKARQQAEASANDVHRAQRALSDAQAAHHRYTREVAVLQERLDFLRKETNTFRAAARPDPSAARTTAEFLAALREFRAWSGNPSFKAMAALAAGPVSATDIANAMRSSALPGLHIVKAMIEGCGGSDNDVYAFLQANERIHSAGA